MCILFPLLYFLNVNHPRGRRWDTGTMNALTPTQTYTKIKRRIVISSPRRLVNFRDSNTCVYTPRPTYLNLITKMYIKNQKKGYMDYILKKLAGI